MEKFQLFDQNHRLTLLEKSRFFNFFNFLILDSKNTFFLSRIVSNTFCGLFVCLFVCFLPKIKRWKSFIFFLPKPWTNPFGEIPVFIFFLNSIFIVLRHFFPFQSIVKHVFLAYFSYKKKNGKKLPNF